MGFESSVPSNKKRIAGRTADLAQRCRVDARWPWCTRCRGGVRDAGTPGQRKREGSAPALGVTLRRVRRTAPDHEASSAFPGRRFGRRFDDGNASRTW